MATLSENIEVTGYLNMNV